MSNEMIMAKVKEKMALASSLNAKVKFDFGDDGIVFVDATQNPPVISQDDAEADTTLVTSLDTFKGILEGSQDPSRLQTKAAFQMFSPQRIRIYR